MMLAVALMAGLWMLWPILFPAQPPAEPQASPQAAADAGRGQPLLQAADVLIAMGLTADSPEAIYSDTLELDLSTVEPSLAGAAPGDRVQFERLGYFCLDPDAQEGKLVFNRTVALRDSWAKIEQQD